jgi:hypothetical protein
MIETHHDGVVVIMRRDRTGLGHSPMILKLQIARLANALGYSVIRRSTFDTLQRESWLLREQSGEAAALRRQLARFLAAGQSELAMSFARTEQEAAAGNGLYTPIYDYVGLRTDPKIIHNHDFMRDTRFVAAYRRGIAAALSDEQAYWRVHVALWCASLAMGPVERGVWRGLLTSAIMNYFDWNACDRHFYLFDTFRGINERHYPTRRSPKVISLISGGSITRRSSMSSCRTFPRLRMCRSSAGACQRH